MASLIQIASTFPCAQLEYPFRQALSDEGFAVDVRSAQFTRLHEYLSSPTLHDPRLHGTVLLVRIEDWLRQTLESESHSLAPAGDVRQILRTGLDDFLSHLTILSRLGKTLSLLTCPSTGWFAEQHRLRAVCRTFSNLLMARAGSVPDIALLRWPASLPEGTFEDRDADFAGNAPLAAEAFRQLGEELGRELGRTFGRRESQHPGENTGTHQLARYFERLAVRVRFTTAGRDDRSQVDRLLRTVSAFSLTGVPSSSGELDHFLESRECVLVDVADNVSNYGPSGIVIFQTKTDELAVDSFALSCTVLGKQVEYAVLSALGRTAANLNCSRITFGYRATARNQPMQAFLDQIAVHDATGRYVISTDSVPATLADVAVSNGAWTILEDILSAPRR